MGTVSTASISRLPLLSTRSNFEGADSRAAAIVSLANTNKHKFSLAALGILPHPLRKLFGQPTSENESALARLRSTFFWGGYKIWKMRQKLVRELWKSRCEIQTTKSRSARRQKLRASACKDPFHFLPKIADLSKRRLTVCPCSRLQVRSDKKLPSIRDFFLSQKEVDIPIDSAPSRPVKRLKTCVPGDDGLDRKHVVSACSRTDLFISHDDVIRGTHDRGKKRKYSQKTISHFFEPSGSVP